MAKTIRLMDNFNLFLNKSPKGIHRKDEADAILPQSKLVREKKKKGEQQEEKQDRRTELTKFQFRDKNVFAALQQRQINHAKALCTKTATPLVMSPDYRLVVGMGNASVYETSLTLHHIHGFPYIPASGIKGALRNYVINTYFELGEDVRRNKSKEELGRAKELNALKDDVFCRIFGCPENSALTNSKDIASAWAGEIVFFDAYPTKSPKIEMDVMTVHYGDYYNGSKPPADWQKTNPIPFLTVGKGSSFQFVVGIRKGCEDNHVTLGDRKAESILSLVSDLLHDALTNHGIGAKTAVGYGYMKPYP